MRTFLKYLLLCPLALLPLAGQPYSFNFGTPVVLSPTEAPGVWYPDRFPPNGFVSPVTAPDGTPNTLQETIAAGDHQPYPASSFSNTQGRKYDLPPSTFSVTIGLYVPSAWRTQNARMAGFWQEACGAVCNGMVDDYGIIDFQGPITTDAGGPSYHPNGGVAGFYGWNNMTGNFDLITSNISYDTWYQLTVTFKPGTGFVYTVGTASINSPLSAAAAISLGNTTLQGYNYAATYSIFWMGGPYPGSFKVRYFTNLNIGDSFIDIVNDGSVITAAAVGSTTSNFSTGNICVNVYAFDPAEEMISCCACLITPDGLASLSVQSDLISNTLTPASPTSVTVELLATAPVVGGVNPLTASQTCDPTLGNGATPGMASPVSSLQAWGSTLHSRPGGTGVTETPFSNATLGITGVTGTFPPLASEQARLAANCGFISSNGSGFGVCRSCRPGGLGAVHQ